MKTISLIALLICFSWTGFGQITDFQYKRKLVGVKNSWHRVSIPNEVFEKMNYPMNDIRIYGITKKNDTIEAAYLKEVHRRRVIIESHPYELINKVRNGKGYYYTLRLPDDVDINELNLSFGRSNYDWEVTLEGSQDLTEWFTIKESSRVLSILDGEANYAYNRIRFSKVRYRYYRLFFPVKRDPQLRVPEVVFSTVDSGKLNQYSIVNQKVEHNKGDKQTVIELTLKNAVPVNKIKINTGSSFDYYRPVTIDYVEDSVKTEKGYVRKYAFLGRGVLSSLENNEVRAEGAIAKRIRITIDNNDNQPLLVEDIEVSGYLHDLITRFTEPGEYYMVYGGNEGKSPRYDIGHFKDKIPESLTAVQVGKEDMLPKKTQNKVEAESSQSENRWWLWSIMGLVIVLLGWFTLKMLRSENGQ